MENKRLTNHKKEMYYGNNKRLISRGFQRQSGQFGLLSMARQMLREVDADAL